MTPFPMPLTTPPDTSMNLVMAGQMSSKKKVQMDDGDQDDRVQAAFQARDIKISGLRQTWTKISIATL